MGNGHLRTTMNSIPYLINTWSKRDTVPRNSIFAGILHDSALISHWVWIQHSLNRQSINHRPVFLFPSLGRVVVGNLSDMLGTSWELGVWER